MNHLFQGISRINSVANHDFCPWANRYVYWLKEPVGWFLIATLASLLVGAFLSPIGWSVAAGLAAILALGLGFPWLAVRTANCQLAPVNHEVHERDGGELLLTVRNRLPIPILGLTVEGYLSQAFDPAIEDQPIPDVGLSQVPAFSQATYRLAIRPEYRGKYPIERPKIACSFPFGIWTARRDLTDVQPVTVWPMLLPSNSDLEIVGKQLAETGNGDRASSHGDFIGVRDFRQGDSLRSIHWAQSARLDNLIVCERGGPQKQTLRFDLCTKPCQGSVREARENLAWRVRIMATLVDLAVSRHMPFQLSIDGQAIQQVAGAQGRKAAWDRLTMIPLDGSPECHSIGTENVGTPMMTRIVISAHGSSHSQMPSHLVRVELKHPSAGVRRAAQSRWCDIDLDQDIASQLTHLFMEATREAYAA